MDFSLSNEQRNWQMTARKFGPSTTLSPSFTRRTVYGKVSRYKLDDYLQLFDFPSPNLSAERRFVTTVPLQRLFFMNSDFMQQQGELIARQVAAEPDNAARIQKTYRLIFGRSANDAEVKAGLAFLTTEPLKAYSSFEVHELYNETPDTITAEFDNPEASYLYVNVWTIENQWTGRELQTTYHWLRDVVGLEYLNRSGNYLLFRIENEDWHPIAGVQQPPK